MEDVKNEQILHVPKGGRVTISTSLETIKNKKILIS